MNKCFCHLNGKEVKDSKARPCGTIYDLRLKPNLNVGDVVSTKGYYETNDGGQSYYIVREKLSNDVDDGGSLIFLRDNKVGVLMKEDIISVRQFGAKGDGINNDTEAINNALKYASNVLISDGIYLVDDELLPKSNQVIHLMNAEIISTNATTEKALFNLNLVNNVIILGYNFTIKFTEAREGQTLIKYNSSNNISIKGLKFENYSNAIFGIGTENLPSTYIIIKENIFDMTSSKNGISVNNIVTQGDVNCLIHSDNLNIELDPDNPENSSRPSLDNGNLEYPDAPVDPDTPSNDDDPFDDGNNSEGGDDTGSGTGSGDDGDPESSSRPEL